ncbi:amino acid adenylation domain-containing protein [Amycolatopsis sp. cmx-11-12]|uniref:amino acid adenylation domain-containing protein n=1 Tax=Amycolatopsis sp. cmx-11-12 TaxID=2785795 RepID=UPI003918649F
MTAPCLHEVVSRQAGRTPDATAIDGADALTYRELDRRANAVAHLLLARGIGRGSLVAVCLPRSGDLAVAMLGVLKAGGAYLPIDPALPPARIAFLCADAAVTLTLTSRRWSDRLPGDPLCLDGLSERDDPPDRGTTPADPACVMYTSGSTGRPLGSVIPHRAVLRLVRGNEFLPIAATDRVAHASNICFDASTFEIWGALAAGACLVVFPDELVLDPRSFAAELRTQRISVLWLTSAYFDLIAATAPDAFATVAQLLVGGDTVHAATVRAVLAAGRPGRLLNAYGPTENTVFSAWYEVRDVPPDAVTVPIGFPVPGTEIQLLDDRLRPVGPDEVGELYLGGDGLALGYHRRPDATAARFVAVAGARLFRTGDLGRYRPDGALDHLGRRDRQVKLRGFRVEPAEVEAALTARPGVAQAVVVARREPARLDAWVVPEPSRGESVVGQWRRLYDEVTYRGIDGGEPRFNITGWVSSYTGEPLPEAEMREQVEQTVARLRELRPRRVLEIGCGTGLLLLPLASETETYWGTDFSTVALAELSPQVAKLPQVRLLNRQADDFSGIAGETFDLVVLNSVVQHFPGVHYLLRVLRKAVRVIRPGGAIFLGDLRSLPLLEEFHRSVGSRRGRQAVAERVRQEPELVLDPDLFPALAQWFPEIGDVRVQLRRGWADNELTRFRYDVVLRIGDRAGTGEPDWLDWPLDGEPADVLRERIPPFGIRGVPNARLAGPGVHPEEFWRLAERLGLAAEIGWSADPHAFDAVFHRPGTPALASPQRTPVRRPADYATDPIFAEQARTLGPRLRRELAASLPDHLVPSVITVLPRLPLTSNGKVALDALPEPALGAPTLQPARSVTERTVAEIWARVLGVPEVSVADNFFDIGGNSLKAAQVVEELRRTFDPRLPLVRLFDLPTVRAFSAALDDRGRTPGFSEERDRGRLRRARRRVGEPG